MVLYFGFFSAAFDLDDRVLDFAFFFFMKELRTECWILRFFNFMKELLRTECLPWNERELDLRFR